MWAIGKLTGSDAPKNEAEGQTGSKNKTGMDRKPSDLGRGNLGYEEKAKEKSGTYRKKKAMKLWEFQLRWRVLSGRSKYFVGVCGPEFV